MVADLEELETMEASEIYSKRLNAKEVIFHTPKRMGNSYFQSQMDEKNYWRRSGTENIHLDTGTPNSRRRSKRFSWTVRRKGLHLHHLKAHIWIHRDARNDFGPCQETSREKNRSQFH